MTSDHVERRRGMDEVREDIAGLRGAVEALGETAAQLAPGAALQAEIESRRRERKWAVAGAVVLALVFAIHAIESRTSQATLDRLEDCTTPGGDCYRDLTGDRSGVDVDAAVERILGGLDGIRCLLLIEPADRTPTNIAPCLGQGGS